MEEKSPQNKTPLRRPVMTIPQQQEDGEKRQRIKIWMGIAMVIVALSIDAFQALLNVLAVGEVLSTIISICADVIFLIWFWTLGLGFIKSPKKFAAMSIQAIVGFIPVLNTLPELTLGILVIVLITRSEDKGGIIGKAASLAQGKVKI